MDKIGTEFPRSFWSFYFSLFKWAITEAYGVVDAFLTFIAFIFFVGALFSKELAHQLEIGWQGLSRWYSIVPVGALLIYRVLKANYAHFEAVVNRVDSVESELQKEREATAQPDVALIWDWPEDQRHLNNLMGSIEKLIIIHNRSNEYVYNVTIAPIKLAQEMTFDDTNEIAPGANHVTRARWNGRTSDSTNYVYFFGHKDNEKEADTRKWIHHKLHDHGVSDSFLKIPMTLSYEGSGVRWECGFDFNYEAGADSVFVKKAGRRT